MDSDAKAPLTDVVADLADSGTDEVTEKIASRLSRRPNSITAGLFSMPG
jgi:hypothetical protein